MKREPKEPSYDTQLKVNMSTFGLSFITRSPTDERVEFIYIQFEALKFIVLEGTQKRKLQLKVDYAQINNNIGHK